MGYKINNSNKKITLVRGDSLHLKVNIYIDGEPYTPSNGDIVRFAMKQTYQSNKVLIHKNIPIDSLELHLEPSDTKKLAFGKYVYDIEITFDNGDVDTFISGEFELTPEVE